jgi:hypothetical protein
MLRYSLLYLLISIILNSFYSSNNSPDEYLQDITEITRGIAFLGTPHSDSALAQCAEILTKSIGILKQTNAEILGSSENGFRGIGKNPTGFPHYGRDKRKAWSAN